MWFDPKILALIGVGITLLGGYAGFTLALALDREKAAKSQRQSAYAQFLTAHGWLGALKTGSPEWQDALEHLKSAELLLDQFGEPKVVENMIQTFGSSATLGR